MMARHGAGLFISFEGGEGGGKSTQLGHLATYLERRGQNVIVTREPGGTPTAEKLRDFLLDPLIELGAMEQVLLFYAARHHHVETVVRPALSKGVVVLCDRFSDSTIAYQGAAGGIDTATIKQIHKLVLGDFQPDLTLLLDMPVEDAFVRVRGRGGAEDRFEAMEHGFHARLRTAFLELAAAEPDRIRTIDARPDEQTVATAIAHIVDDRWPV